MAWKVRPHTSALYCLYVEATRKNLKMSELPAEIKLAQALPHPISAQWSTKWQMAHTHIPHAQITV
jgi:hypothetical protein